MINDYETSFPYEVDITSAKDLQEGAAISDYCMACFKDGYTEKGVFKTAHKCARDFIFSEVLYADIDNDNCNEQTQYTIKEFQQKFARYEYFITTSKSHQRPKNENPPLDRFHVLFPINKVDDAEKMRGYLAILNSYFFPEKTMDTSCIDIARKFFGNPNNISYYNPGRSIGIVVDELWNQQNIEKAEKTKEIRRIEIPRPVLAINSLKDRVIPSVDKAFAAGWFDEYKNWMNVGFAIKDAGFDVSIWHRCCYTEKDRKLATKKWQGMKPNGRINGMQYLWKLHMHFGLS